VYTTGSQIGGIIALTTATAWYCPYTGQWRLTFAFYGALAFIAGAAWWLMSAISRARRMADTTGNCRPGRRSPRCGRCAIATGPTVSLVTFRELAIGLEQLLPKILQSGRDDSNRGRAFGPQSLVWSASAGRSQSRAWRPIGHRRRVLALAACAIRDGMPGSGDIYRPPQLIGRCLEGSGEAASNPLLMLILMETPEVGAKNMGAAAPYTSHRRDGRVRPAPP